MSLDREKRRELPGDGRSVGEGGMGAVYLAEHPLIGKRVAHQGPARGARPTKEDIVARFFNEAKAVNDIGHPNIVDIVDFGKIATETARDVVYFIMEFLDGESLADAPPRARAVSPPSARTSIAQVAARARRRARARASSTATSSPTTSILVHARRRQATSSRCSTSASPSSPATAQRLVAQDAHRHGDGHAARTCRPSSARARATSTTAPTSTRSAWSCTRCSPAACPFAGEGYGEILVAHLTRPPSRRRSCNPDIPPELEAW